MSAESDVCEGESLGFGDVLVEVGVLFGGGDDECFNEPLDDGVGFCGGLDLGGRGGMRVVLGR